MIAEIDLTETNKVMAEALHGAIRQFIQNEILSELKGYPQKDSTWAIFGLQADRFKSILEMDIPFDPAYNNWLNDAAAEVTSYFITKILERK